MEIEYDKYTEERSVNLTEGGTVRKNFTTVEAQPEPVIAEELVFVDGGFLRM